MNKKKIKSRIVLCIAFMLAASMVVGTVAYATQEITTRNEFQLGKYSTELVEEFEAPDNWMPGAEVNKDVLVKNSGTVPVYAKVIINQKWIRMKDVYDENGAIIKPVAGTEFPLTFDSYQSTSTTADISMNDTAEAGIALLALNSKSTGADNYGEPAGATAYAAAPLASGTKKYAALIKWGSDVVLLSSGKTSVPSLSLGLPTVGSAADAKGKWLLISETPDKKGNLTFYYVGELAADASTPQLLDGVEMNPDIQATTLLEETVWDEANQKWVTTTTKNSASSYENARYTLGVTMNTVQATKDALKEMFHSNGTTEQAVISYLETLGTNTADHSRDDTVKQKKLYFEEVNGEMRYTPSTGSENWFMSHLNMMPGESFTDTLEITNDSKKTYDLYMQAVPLVQTTIQDELLEKLHMKVYHGTDVIYEGTAMGKEYAGNTGNLQNKILLGNYAPSAAKNIKVELTLDKDIPIESADVLSQIDWKFTVEDKAPAPTPTPAPANPEGPKTGDEQDNTWYILLMGIAGTAFAVCVIYLIAAAAKRKREDNFYGM